MRNLPLWLFLFALSSCGGEQNPADPKKSELAGKQDMEIRLTSYFKSDTLRFNSDSARMLITGLGKTWQGTDSVRWVAAEFSLWQGGKPLSLLRDTFNTTGEEELFSMFECEDTTGTGPERFVNVGFGFPACGYVQQHRVLSISGGRLELLARYESSADGPYSTGTTFYGLCGEGSTVYSVVCNSEGEDNEEGWMLTKFSDSVAYTHEEKGWQSKLLTPAGSVFRQTRTPWQ